MSIWMSMLTVISRSALVLLAYISLQQKASNLQYLEEVVCLLISLS